jgi:environmental stress-induced protein Ves
MNHCVILCADVPPQPWRNGGGLTRELLAWPPGDGWRLRISVAEICADGPFSVFAGVRRWFAVLEGAGVALTVDGTPHHQTRTDPPLAFDGGAHTDCRLLAGPTRDLNLMLRGAGPAGGDTGGLFSVVAGQDWQPGSAPCGLFSASAGRCVAGAQTIALPASALLCFARMPGLLRFEPDAAPTDAAAIPPGWWWSAGAAPIQPETAR